MRTFRAELHIHTVLSPCAEIEMLPPLIIKSAVEKGIQLIAITDHNATGNIEAVILAARGSGIIVLAGMEVQTKEEVHSLCLFDTIDQAKQLQEVVDSHRLLLENNAELFGIQLEVDENGEFLREDKRLLLSSISLSIEKTAEVVHALGGIFIPAHIDRKAFGLIENLGFVPENLKADALELSPHMSPALAFQTFPQIAGFPLLQNGDAHRLNEIIGQNQLEIESASIDEIRQALQGLNGRKYSVI